MELRTSDIALVALADRAEARELAWQLTHRGWQVLLSPDGPTAREALCSRPITLAIVAARLPMMGGIEMVASARAAGWRGSAVFVDAVDSAEARQQAARLGAIAYLVQPVPSRSLWPILERLRGLTPSTSSDEQSIKMDRAARFVAGSRLRLALGPRPDGYEAIITDVGAASPEFTVQGIGVSLPLTHLGAAVQVGFPASRGWGEFSSRVVGSSTRGQFTEITLSAPDHVVYHQRRRCARLEAAFPLDVWPLLTSGCSAASVPGQVEDIAQAGLCASLCAAVSATEFVALDIDAGEGGRLRFTARPVWYRPPSAASALTVHRYGFQFVSLSRTLRGQLRELLSRLRCLPGPPASHTLHDGAPGSGPTVRQRGPYADCSAN